MPMKRIAVTPHAASASGYAEAKELLEWLGYDVVECATVIPKGFRYVVDARHPNWFGWKGALSAIVVHHYPQMQEWNREKAQGLVLPAVSAESLEPDDDCPT